LAHNRPTPSSNPAKSTILSAATSARATATVRVSRDASDISRAKGAWSGQSDVSALGNRSWLGEASGIAQKSHGRVNYSRRLPAPPRFTFWQHAAVTLPFSGEENTMEAIAVRPAGGAGVTSQTTDFFGIAARRLDYIDQRQRVLAQNIANADTPNYHARDLSPFEKALTDTAIAPTQTNAAHLAGTLQSANLVLQPATEIAPDGNDVSVESQLTHVADDETSAALVGNLWKTTMGMYLTALGRGG
jgi:flagellar basal-body rod protein FlgB